MVRALVAGGTGHLGRLVVAQFAAHGQEVRMLSRHGTATGTAPGVVAASGDLTDGRGLADAVAGVDVVVDTTDAVCGAQRLFVDGTQRLVDAAAAADVRHVVGVGVEALAGLYPYYRAKLAQEQVLAGGAVRGASCAPPSSTASSLPSSPVWHACRSCLCRPSRCSPSTCGRSPRRSSTRCTPDRAVACRTWPGRRCLPSPISRGPGSEPMRGAPRWSACPCRADSGAACVTAPCATRTGGRPHDLRPVAGGALCRRAGPAERRAVSEDTDVLVVGAGPTGG